MSTSPHTPLKRCTQCKQEFPATKQYFHAQKLGAYGVSSRCKQCIVDLRKERQTHPPVPIPDGYKRCTQCQQVLPATKQYFTVHNEGAYGLRGECKQCFSARHRKTIPDVLPEGFKRCGKCKSVYPATTDYFQCDSRLKDGFHGSCKNCTNTTNKHILTRLPVPEGYKRCLKCGEAKLHTPQNFPLVQGRERNHCRSCINANKRRNYRSKHPQDVVPEGFKRCAACLEVKPATKQYFGIANESKGMLHSRCKPCGKAYRAIIHAKSRLIPYPLGTMKQCSICKQWFPATSEYFHKGRIRHGGLRAMCKPCYKVRWQEYGREHPEVLRAKYHRRRARLKAIPGTYTPAQIREQLKRQHYCCYYARCGFAKFPRVNGQYVYEVEHTFPISRVAGMGIPANDISYLVLSCKQCNDDKGTKFPWEWFPGGRLL